MTDDLDDLRAALKSTPAPEAAAKARALALAMENFDRLQGSTDPDRSSEDRQSPAAPLNGVRRMLSFLTSRPALAASTSAAALVIGIAVILPVTDLRLPVSMQEPVPGPAPKSAPAKDLARSTESEISTSIAEAPPAVEAAIEPLAVPTGLSDEALPSAPSAIAESELGQRMESDAPGGAVGYIALDPAFAPLPDARLTQPDDSEAYANAPANPVKVTAEEPVSTFSIDVDTASWSVIRSTLGMGVLPRAEQVRVEEMVNYFPYSYPAPAAEAAFSSTVSVMPTPWNPGTRLVTIGIQGALPAVEDRPPLNLVFLIDTSGSMEGPDRLGLLRQSLTMMLAELRPDDQIAIVTYAGSAGQVLAPTKAADRAAILAALDNLSAGGSTAGAEGLELAYRVAEGMKAEGEVSRILLATDGDFNVGISDPDGLEAYVAKQRRTGTYLSVLGFGRGNLDDATMQALAQNGNGQAAYIDTLSEARKVLVDQLTGALFPIADDVKIQVEWNPATVAEYRLIGYETRALRREDFNNDAVDAGEIGAGRQVTAIYEITAPGSDALRNDPLRYGTAATAPVAGAELGFLRLRWKAPGEDASTLIETPITGTEEATAETRFAAAIAGFGQLLQGSVYLGDWGWDQAIDLALSARGDDPYGYRIEAVNLMRLAQSLAAN
ncbi:VWA domain-containing protein [Tabrizicola sp.]|uniref:vWA domain-containing protein n=1 Tax=Tabrizicola sp. TaxID=2005166 RepID=UPI002610364E|nr:VWA domain-containing protein [Tabrizicola sp.]MDM7933133.1 VWA domain-containing protein [Tabrizicola sp.]